MNDLKLDILMSVKAKSNGTLDFPCNTLYVTARQYVTVKRE